MNKEHINNGDFLTIAAAHKFKFDIVRELNAVKQHNYVIVNEGNVILKMQRFALNDEFIGWAAFDRIAGVLYVSYSELYTGNEKEPNKFNFSESKASNMVKKRYINEGKITEKDIDCDEETQIVDIPNSWPKMDGFISEQTVLEELESSTVKRDKYMFTYSETAEYNDVFTKSLILCVLNKNRIFNDLCFDKKWYIVITIYNGMEQFGLSTIDKMSYLEFATTKSGIAIIIHHRLFRPTDYRITTLFFEDNMLRMDGVNQYFKVTLNGNKIDNGLVGLGNINAQTSIFDGNKNIVNEMNKLMSEEINNFVRKEAVKTIVNKLGGIENGKNR